jgi:hypothetical protein
MLPISPYLNVVSKIMKQYDRDEIRKELPLFQLYCNSCPVTKEGNIHQLLKLYVSACKIIWYSITKSGGLYKL